MADDVPASVTELSRRLAEAVLRVADVADSAAKQAMSRRLIAITNVAKHDVATAARRLDSLLADLDEGHETTEN